MRRWGNCLFHAIRCYRRWGGYIVIRRSRHGPFPHFMWTHSVRFCWIEEFVPREPKRGWRVLFDMLVFNGIARVKRGDEDDGADGAEGAGAVR